jgi:hypothetical protein
MVSPLNIAQVTTIADLQALVLNTGRKCPELSERALQTAGTLTLGRFHLEFLNVSRGVDLADLPHREALAAVFAKTAGIRVLETT